MHFLAPGLEIGKWVSTSNSQELRLPFPPWLWLRQDIALARRASTGLELEEGLSRLRTPRGLRRGRYDSIGGSGRRFTLGECHLGNAGTR
jgi:hypothetical protein